MALLSGRQLQEQLAADRAKRAATVAANSERMLAMSAAVDGPLLEVLELHAPDEFTGEGCTGCDEGYLQDDYAPWPCRTVQIIGRATGVALS